MTGLLRLVSLRTGKILSVSELGRDARMRSAAVSSYLSLMVVSCFLYRLAPFLEMPCSGNKGIGMI